MNQPITVFFIGYSGCGKDTQAGLLQKFLEKRDGLGSVLYIYTGDELRKFAEGSSYTAKKIKNDILEVGGKAPDFLAIYAWAEVFNKNFKPEHHLLFSSSPRTAIEAQILDEAMGFYGREKVYPVFLNVSREEAFSRLKKRGRSDDTDEVIRSRLDFFDREVRPALEYYKTQIKNKLVDIDGNPHDENKIHEDILKALALV